jgi:hypothetical protein
VSGVDTVEAIGSFAAEMMFIVAAESTVAVGKIKEAIGTPIAVVERSIKVVIEAVVRIASVGRFITQCDGTSVSRATRGEQDRGSRENDCN